MIGPKKLAVIRNEIEEALVSGGDDPIQRLDRLIATSQRKGDRTEILKGLQRFLKSPSKRATRKPRSAAKK
jgi:hypothetical protein